MKEREGEKEREEGQRREIRGVKGIEEERKQHSFFNLNMAPLLSLPQLFLSFCYLRLFLLHISSSSLSSIHFLLFSSPFSRSDNAIFTVTPYCCSVFHSIPLFSCNYTFFSILIHLKQYTYVPLPTSPMLCLLTLPHLHFPQQSHPLPSSPSASSIHPPYTVPPLPLLLTP